MMKTRLEKMNDIEYIKLANRKAKKIIKENMFMDLATSDKNCVPWASPMKYYIDGDYNFYFISSKHSRHMENIMVNPNVSFSIYDSRAIRSRY
jgi:nitroimidazol reductase NimA-like FMN-containing flavoprotein (pyridoxamine 5'-phosphate oxidase superfamily)